VRDAAALLDAMAGPTPQDWIWQAPPSTGTFLAACDDEPRGLRIGRYITPAVAGAEVHPECVAAYEHATELLTSLGHTVEDHPTTFGAELIALFENLWSVEFASLPVPPEAEDGLRPLTKWLRERGRALSALEIWNALATLRTTARQELERTAHFDAVLTPTIAQLPAKVGGLRNDADPAQDFENQKRFTPFTAPYNMSGQPSINVPLHWTDATADQPTLPVGIQLVGRPGDEVTLLRITAQLEAAEPWSDRKPPCW
jgi:amidase